MSADFRIRTAPRRFGAAARSLKHRIEDERGSFTLESSLVSPVLLLAVFAVVFLGLVMYHRANVYHDAAMAAERSAFVWDNSHKDPATGLFSIERWDGLYWRTTSDSVSDMFGFLFDNEPSRISLPDGAPDAAPGQPEYKLHKAAGMLPSGLEGTLTYDNKFINRHVTVQLRKQSPLPPFLRNWIQPVADATVRSQVTEPVELIRTVDFVRSYIPLVVDKLSRRRANELLPSENAKPPEKLTFRSEAEASAYLRKMVNGVEVYVNTPSQKNRKLDALDPDGLFHEAKCGYTAKSKQIEQQIAKDLELLRSGTIVKGVVWHFFRDADDGTVGPSKPLRQALEKHGIIVIIHD